MLLSPPPRGRYSPLAVCGWVQFCPVVGLFQVPPESQCVVVLPFRLVNFLACFIFDLGLFLHLHQSVLSLETFPAPSRSRSSSVFSRAVFLSPQSPFA